MISTVDTLQVIYEDNHLIAVNKRPGDLTQGDNSGDMPLVEIVKQYLKIKYNKPGNVFCGVVHRLDRPVSGLVLFARTGKALERMNEIFRSRTVQKTYWAVVKNKPARDEDVLQNYLLKIQKINRSVVTDSDDKDALLCEVHYKLIAKSDKYFLLEVNPRTGRHHQIRVQLSNIKCPIKGDLKYGYDRSNEDGSIHLHARKLVFEHPVKKEPMELTAVPPDDVLWNYFVKYLEAKA